MSKQKNQPVQPVFTPPSRLVWTDERLAGLDKDQLANLLQNLRTQRTSGRVSEETAEDLEQRIKSRLPARSPVLRRKRPRSEVRAEARAAEQLGDLATDLARRYELSPEAAITASAGIKGFRPEPKTDSKGLARAGASVKHGVASVERYVGYRCRDSFAGLAFVILAGHTEEPGRYVLLGTDDLIDEGSGQEEYAELAGQHGWSAASRPRMRAHAVSGFEEGSQRYEALIAQLGTLKE